MAIVPSAIQDLQNVWYTLSWNKNGRDPLAFVIDHLKAIHERLKTVPTHPLAVEPLTSTAKLRAMISLNGIIKDILLHQDLAALPPELERIRQELRQTLTHISQLNKIKAISKLAHLTEDLEKSLRDASRTLIDFRNRYLSTPQEVHSLDEALDLIKEIYKSLSIKISMVHFGLKEVSSHLDEDLQQIMLAHPPFLNDARAYITKIYDCLSSTSKSLFFNLEEFQAVITDLYLDSSYFSTQKPDPMHCEEGLEPFNAIDRIESLCYGLINAMENPRVSLAKLLLNMARLRKLIEEYESAKSHFVLFLTELENKHEQLKIRLCRLAKARSEPSFKQKLEMEDCERRENQLKYTREHIQDILSNPRLERCKETLNMLSGHPRMSNYLNQPIYPSALNFETDFWLLKPLVIRKQADCDRICGALNHYSMLLKPLIEMLQGKNNPHPSFITQKSPFITLGNIEEALFGVSTING